MPVSAVLHVVRGDLAGACISARRPSANRASGFASILAAGLNEPAADIWRCPDLHRAAGCLDQPTAVAGNVGDAGPDQAPAARSGLNRGPRDGSAATLKLPDKTCKKIS